MKVGNYTLRVLCDNTTPHSNKIEINGPNKARCLEEAAKRGWYLSRKVDLCPGCAKAINAKKPPRGIKKHGHEIPRATGV